MHTEIIVLIFNYFQLSYSVKQYELHYNPYLTKPIKRPNYIKEPYLLLMFNGSKDIETNGELSHYTDEGSLKPKYTGKWVVEKLQDGSRNDYGLVTKSNNSFYAISFGLKKTFVFSKSPRFVFQYDFRFQKNHECGGGYVKLMPTSGFNMKSLSNKSRYSILFGPDQCGIDYKLRLHYNYKNKKNEFVERKPIPSQYYRYPKFLTDNVTHVITLAMFENNTYQIYKNFKLVREGNLVSEFEPPLSGEKYIVDTEDKKPQDWDDRKEIQDPNDNMPDDWDESEPEYIPDQDAKKPKTWLDSEPLMVPLDKPSTWDESTDGVWTKKMVKNPKCKNYGCGEWTMPWIRNPRYRGVWEPKIIPNPNYKGEWKPRMILNPQYDENVPVYQNLLSIGSIGIEIWSTTSGTIFDNFLITDNISDAFRFAWDTWWPKFYHDTTNQTYYRDGILMGLTEKAARSPHVKLKYDSNYFSLTTVVFDHIHWLWALLPLLIFLPALLYLSILLYKRRKLSRKETRERCLMTTYNRLRFSEEYQKLAGNNGDSDKAYQHLLEVSDEAINRMFGNGPDDKVSAVLRQRIRDIFNIPGVSAQTEIVKNNQGCGDTM